MRVKCVKCELEDIGRYKKLVQRGWKIFFLEDGVKVVRCKKCKPNFKDKIKKILNKDYKPEMYYDIKEAKDRLKMLKNLTPREELIKQRLKKIKKSRNYKYQRNKKDGK